MLESGKFKKVVEKINNGRKHTMIMIALITHSILSARVSFTSFTFSS